MAPNIEPLIVMVLSALRVVLAAVLLSLLGIVSACAADPGANSPKPGSPSYTIALTQGNKVLIPEESLSVELVAVKDGRCPQGAQCIWAGHAAVTIQVAKAGSPPETLVIGTPAPPHMKLPHEATYGAYRLNLLGLEPANPVPTSATPPRYRATVQVTRL